MVAAPALAERGRSQIPSVSEAHQLDPGLEQGVPASEAADLGRFVLHTRTTSEIRPRPGGHGPAQERQRVWAVRLTGVPGKRRRRMGRADPHPRDDMNLDGSESQPQARLASVVGGSSDARPQGDAPLGNGFVMNASWCDPQTPVQDRLGVDPRGTRSTSVPGGNGRAGTDVTVGPSMALTAN